MALFARIAAVFGLLILSACGSAGGTAGSTASGWNLQDVAVRFGPDIKRTDDGLEFNSNFVWNGYSAGNRKKQVVGLFKTSMSEVGSRVMNGTRPVRMNVQVNYFHALTDASRLWCCGSHKIFADLEVVDAASGQVLAADQNVALGRIALGGIPGLVATAAGRDQDVRIREGIVNATTAWLSRY